MMSRRIAGVLGAAALALSVTAPAAQAAEPEPLSPRMLQQTVLRVQFPKTLGPWQQYMYGTLRKQAPTVCWGATGSITLPPASVVGFVNYQVDPTTNGTVSIYQYGTEAQAAAALATLQQADRKSTGSRDHSLASLTTYLEPGEDIRGYVSTLSTQAGLAIVQTEVGAYRPLLQSAKQRQAALDQVASVNDRWHAQVVKAYQNFGVEGTAR